MDAFLPSVVPICRSWTKDGPPWNGPPNSIETKHMGFWRTHLIAYNYGRVQALDEGLPREKVNQYHWRDVPMLLVFPVNEPKLEFSVHCVLQISISNMQWTLLEFLLQIFSNQMRIHRNVFLTLGLSLTMYHKYQLHRDKGWLHEKVNFMKVAIIFFLLPVTAFKVCIAWTSSLSWTPPPHFIGNERSGVLNPDALHCEFLFEKDFIYLSKSEPNNWTIFFGKHRTFVSMNGD